MWLSPYDLDAKDCAPCHRFMRSNQEVVLQCAGAGDAERPGQLDQNKAGDAGKVRLVMRCNVGHLRQDELLHAHAAMYALEPKTLSVSGATVAYASSLIPDCCPGSMQLCKIANTLGTRPSKHDDLFAVTSDTICTEQKLAVPIASACLTSSIYL